MALDDLYHELLKVQAEALGNHQWADYRNVTGFASGIALRGANLLWDTAPNTLGHQALDKLMMGAVALERASFGAPWDTSQEAWLEPLWGVVVVIKRGMERVEARPGVHYEMPRWDTSCHTLGGGTLAVVNAVIERTSLPDAERALIVGAICAGLKTPDIAACAAPWRARDQAPDSDEALAFEAALDAGQREFAYRMFERA